MDSEEMLIEMKSIQSVYSDRTETELTTGGKYRKEGDTYIISYMDSAATGFVGSETSVKVTGDKIASISRRGTSFSDLVVEPGKRHLCHYGTPYGDVVVGVYTHSIRNELGRDGGHLYLKYTIDINTSYMSDYEIILNVRKG